MGEDLDTYLRTSDLQGRFSSIKDRVKNEFLRFWQAHAPHFTDHGINHCESVEKTAAEILTQEVLHDTEEYEIFLLLASFWLHDIGMMYKRDPSEDDLEIRRTHNERSRELIRSEFTNLLPVYERIVIGDICWAHSSSADITSLPVSRTLRHAQLGNQRVRVQFLAAILRLCDALDVCCTRTSEVLRSVAQLPELALFYHSLHSRVSGLILDNSEIIIDIYYTDESEIQVLTDYIITPANLELDSVRNILGNNSVYLSHIIPNYILTEGLEPLPDPPSDDEDENESSREYSEKTELIIRLLSELREGNRDAAEPIIQELLEIDRTDPKSWMLYCRFYFEESDIPKSLEGIENARAFDPSNISYRSLHGHILGEYQLDLPGSLTVFEEAYELAPEDESLVLNYSESLMLQNRVDEARELLNDVMNKTQLLKRIIYSKFLLLSCDAIQSNTLSSLKNPASELASLLETTNAENVNWIFNKLRYYLDGSSLQENVKKLLYLFMDHIEGTLSKNQLSEQIRQLFLDP